MPAPEADRRAQLQTALVAVRQRIAAGCRAAHRDPDAVTLIAVTKTCPASDVVALAGLGLRDVAESRDQEAAAKVSAVAGLDRPEAQGLRWHFVGRLQSRKCRSVARYAHAVHSVDRPELVDGLAAGMQAADRDDLLDIFVQVSLDNDPGRGGAPLADVVALAAAVADRPQLRLRGVMAVAPLGVDPHAAFSALAEAAARVRAEHPAADAVSAGMSADLEAALAHGATHVRVGSALLGRRGQVFS